MSSLPFAALAGARRGFARDARFARDAAPAPVQQNVQHEPPQRVQRDPLAEAFAEGRAAGLEEARTACAADLEAREAAMAAIEIACARLDDEQRHLLAERLRTTVLALCDGVLAQVALDPDALTRRVEAAARMLARADDARVIRLHPDDLALARPRLPAEWNFEPDPDLERGALRIEGAAGGVEDGPALWRAAIEEALGAC